MTKRLSEVLQDRLEEERMENRRLREALKDIARLPEGDEQSAQAVALEALLLPLQVADTGGSDA